MGLEAKCQARCANQIVQGRLHLDSQTLTFSGSNLKWEVALGPKVAATVEEGWLHVSHGKKIAAFALGTRATSWAEKILHPPSRAQKLGLKPGQACWLSSDFPSDFLADLETLGIAATRHIKDCSLAFLLLKTKADLGRLSKVAARLPPGVSLWIVWTKGDPKLTQAEVMGHATTCGLGPSKVAAFDARLTAMRYAKKK